MGDHLRSSRGLENKAIDGTMQIGRVDVELEETKQIDPSHGTVSSLPGLEHTLLY